MAQAWFSDVPLICDKVFSDFLIEERIDAVVLSDDILKLWHVKSLVEQTNDGDGYGRTIRIIDNDYNNDVDTCNNLNDWVFILHADMLEKYLYRFPAARVLMVDQRDKYLQQFVASSTVNCIYAFTRMAWWCRLVNRENLSTLKCLHLNPSKQSTQQRLMYEGVNGAAGCRRNTFHGFSYFLQNESMLKRDNVYRFNISINDPNDSMFWRNLVSVLLKHNKKSADTSRSVLIDLYVPRETNLLELRLKRFLAFLVTVNQAISKAKLRSVKRIWWVCSNKAALSWYLCRIYDENFITHSWKLMQNVDCFLQDNNFQLSCSLEQQQQHQQHRRRLLMSPSVRIIDCCGTKQKQRVEMFPGIAIAKGQAVLSAADFTSERNSDGRDRAVLNRMVTVNDDENVIGLFHNSLLLKQQDFSRIFTNQQFGFSLMNSAAIVQKLLNGAPIFVFQPPRHT